MENIDVEADTIDFRPKITYFFREDMSGGTEDDLITLVDIPYVVLNRYYFSFVMSYS